MRTRLALAVAATAVATSAVVVVLTRDERQRPSAAYLRSRATWIASFNVPSRLRRAEALPRAPMLSRKYPPPKATPQAAARAAETVVAGRVTSVWFAPDGTQTVLQADDGRVVPFHQDGGPEPGPGFTDGTLAYAENAPLILPGPYAGQRVVLLLERDRNGALRVQSYTGMYLVGSEGRVRALPGNPFRAQVDGLTERELLALLGR